jgi:hypothetical protein
MQFSRDPQPLLSGSALGVLSVPPLSFGDP